MVASSWMPELTGQMKDRNQVWGQKRSIIILWMMFGVPGLD